MFGNGIDLNLPRTRLAPRRPQMGMRFTDGFPGYSAILTGLPVHVARENLNSSQISKQTRILILNRAPEADSTFGFVKTDTTASPTSPKMGTADSADVRRFQMIWRNQSAHSSGEKPYMVQVSHDRISICSIRRPSAASRLHHFSSKGVCLALFRRRRV